MFIITLLITVLVAGITKSFWAAFITYIIVAALMSDLS